MKSLIVYTSVPASGQMSTFLLAVAAAHDVVIRPVSALPAPDAQHRQRLRTERVALREAIAQARHELDRYHYGERQPDAGHQAGLQFDLDALTNRLRAVDTVLGAEKGGVGNG